MKNMKAKIASAALVTTMLFGGAQVFADQNPAQCFHGNLRVEAHRASRYSTWSYDSADDIISVRDTGRYTVLINCDREFPKTITISDAAGNVISEISTTDSVVAYDVDLYSGEDFTISVSAENFVTNSQAHDGSTDINVFMTLEEAYPDVLPAGLQDDHCDETMFVGGANGNPNQAPVFPQGMISDHCDETMFVGGANGNPNQEPVLPQGMISDHCDETMFVGGANGNPNQEPVFPQGMISDHCDESMFVVGAISLPLDDAKLPDTSRVVVASLTVEQIRAMSVDNFVGHMYLECLGREASQAEINFWADKLMNGDITATSVAAQMLTSEEFENRNISDEEFVAILTSVFGDGISEQTALAALASGKTRSGVINQFAGSEQWASKCAFYCVNA